MGLSQAALSEQTGINRSMLSRLESQEFTPSIEQLESLARALDFEPTDMFIDESIEEVKLDRPYKIAVAGTGYVGLSLAVLMAQHNDVTAVDIVPEKAEMINNYTSPIQDDYIEKYLEEAKEGKRRLGLTATTDGAAAYADAEYIIIATPTNYDPNENYFDCSAVESVISLIQDVTKDKE